jgi:hypothetical protein
MRNLDTLPLVSCQLNFENASADVDSFETGARAAGWTDEEIRFVVEEAREACDHLDEVGEILYYYFADDSW